MKKLIIIFVCFIIINCGGGNDEGDNNSEGIKILLSGNIFNNTTTSSGKLSGKTFDGTEERIADIVIGKMITISTRVENIGDVNLSNLAMSIELEDEIFLTPERWICKQCFPYYSGEGCNGVIEVIGGDINNPQPTPDMSSCDGTPAISGYCIDTFPDGLDCFSPSWSVEYQTPGDGLWKASLNISSLVINQVWESSVGYGHSAIDLRYDHYAGLFVKDNKGVELASKTYIFNIISSPL